MNKEAFKKHYALVERIAGDTWEDCAKGDRSDLPAHKILHIALDTFDDSPPPELDQALSKLSTYATGQRDKALAMIEQYKDDRDEVQYWRGVLNTTIYLIEFAEKM